VAITEIDQIEFNSEEEGYIAARQGGQGVILRTITGGAIWWVLPEDLTAGSIPLNDYINDLALWGQGSNTVFAAGLDDDATTGFLVKAAA
jgi:hypothetical protein